MSHKPYNWEQIRTDYLSNPLVTLSILSEKYDIPEGTIGARMAKEGWRKAKQANTKYVNNHALDKTLEKRVNKAVEFNTQDIDIANKLKNAALKILDATPDEHTPQELHAICKAAETAQRIGRLALGLTTDNSGIQETSDPIDDLRAAQDYLKEHGIDIDRIEH